MGKIRKPGGGRKKSKPEYDAGKNLKEQMDAAVVLYNSNNSLQAIAETLNLNPIKVRKLLITAGVYESDVVEKVQDTFEGYRETQDYKTAILLTAKAFNLFVLFKDKVGAVCFTEKTKNIICDLGSATLGSYLVHVMFVQAFSDRFMMATSYIYPFASIPIAILIFVGGYIVTSIVKKIPFVGKWIV